MERGAFWQDWAACPWEGILAGPGASCVGVCASIPLGAGIEAGIWMGSCHGLLASGQTCATEVHASAFFLRRWLGEGHVRDDTTAEKRPSSDTDMRVLRHVSGN